VLALSALLILYELGGFLILNLLALNKEANI